MGLGSILSLFTFYFTRHKIVEGERSRTEVCPAELEFGIDPHSFASLKMRFLTIVQALVVSSYAAMGYGYSSVSSISKDDWDELNRTVSGRLQIGVPMMQSCFFTVNGSYQIPNEAECNVLQTNKLLGSFVAGHFGGYQNV